MFKRIAHSMPNLKLELAQANIKIEPYNFIKKSFIKALIVSLTLSIALLMVMLKVDKGILFPIILFPILFLIVYFYFIRVPKAKVRKKLKEIDKEIIYAGRFLLIELSSGIPLYNALINVSNSYKLIGKHFQEIINKVQVGKPIEEAINEVIAITPSPNFRKLLWQIINSLRTGADISQSLNSIVNQISEEQLIQVKDYGRKLNPMVMFYLMIAVIAPSLGIVMLALLSSFIGLNIGLGMLIGIAIFIGFIQFMFLTMINSSRPGVEV